MDQPPNTPQPGAAIRRRGVLAAAIMLGALTGPSALAQSRTIDPVRIDEAVARFTGAQVGAIGGARHRADRRLRLSDCQSGLITDWHGIRQSTVKVSCPDPSGWHIYIAVKTAPKAAIAPDIIRRGDSVTIAVEGRGFSIRRPGEAQQSGAAGDWIKVKTNRKGDPISAQIVRQGLVSVPL